MIVIFALERIHGHVGPLTPERKFARYLENVYYISTVVTTGAVEDCEGGGEEGPHSVRSIVTIVRCVMVMYGCVGESSVSLHVVRSMITDILRPAGGHG